ncbi:hypothetical protein [Noviherbaspirillum pedocola]|uniref:Lipoprotein n=1 Tax=Noviherbaspirillum pedocola TaxID=2801341 RepID=A0A934T0F3_9BURK|nr:hypothetical protein [Noviherbaspirillum pedocola]MBK4735083.1 hypothetical protein [Noviherbaspirillum pedocola]
MKTAFTALSAALILTGCLTTDLAKKDDAPQASSETPKVAETPATPSPAPVASAQQVNGGAPCHTDATKMPMGKVPAKGKNGKAKTTPKDQADAGCPSGASAVAPGQDKAATVAEKPAAAPADKATAAAAQAGAARREVKGVNDWSGYIEGTPAPGSKFGKLQIGMGQKEVMDLVGTPNDQQAHVTGKAWIPFYFGSGKYETYLYYKGQGRLLFAGNAGFSTGSALIGIENDAAERGYAR